MVSRQQKREMHEYVTSALEGSSSFIEPRTKEIISGIDSNYILVGKGASKGLVLMVDQPYPNQALNEFYRTASNQGLDSAFIFFKDGKTFFRSAMIGENEKPKRKSKRYKHDYELSLKNYSDEELRRMIVFRPEEEFAMSKRSYVQYYQPNSERLEQGIVSYSFEPVVFDYSHIPADERFTYEQEDSKKLRVWKDRSFDSGKLKLENGLLAPA